MSTQTVVPPKPPRNKLVWTLVGALLAGALSYGGWRLDTALSEDVSCAPGVTEQDNGECVGVTDGSFAFPSLGEEISGRILAENQRLEKSGEEYVTVAYLESMSGGSEDRGPEGTRQAVAGAHVAQLELNEERDTLPRIRLLLANTGRDDAYAKQVVGQLLAMKDKEHLVAVAGIGQSDASTATAVDALRKAGVPTVGATVAADELRSKVPGFFRVSFPAGTQAAAAARYFQQEKKAHPGYRLQVIRDNKVGDVYDASLYTGFTAAARRLGLKIEEIVPYTSGAAPGQGNALRVVADKVCGGDPPDGVYFAGRGRELRSFIEAAGETSRSCPVTVLSGSSAVGVYFDTTGQAKAAELAELGRRWKAGGLHVYYTAYTHPRASAQLYGGLKHSPYPGFERRYLDILGAPDDPSALDNGQAMDGHDALYTIGIAARRALDSYGATHLTPATVLDLLGQVNGTYQVRGVSGLIAFDPDTGEPTERPMALVELGAPGTGERTGARGDEGRYRFVRTLGP